MSIENEEIETVTVTKLLGTYITNDLSWDKNTSEIVKSAYQRMQILHRAAKFTNRKRDLRNIYISYIRSILEKSAVVWHSSLTNKNRKDLERVQRCATYIMMGKDFKNYKTALKDLNLETLEQRRNNLCLKFAKSCLKNEKVKNLFPLNRNEHKMEKRSKEKYKVMKIKTNRYKKSAIPHMVNLLNSHEKKKIKHLSE